MGAAMSKEPEDPQAMRRRLEAQMEKDLHSELETKEHDSWVKGAIWHYGNLRDSHVGSVQECIDWCEQFTDGDQSCHHWNYYEL